MDKNLFQRQRVLRVRRVDDNDLAAQIGERLDLGLRHQLGWRVVGGRDENHVDTGVLDHGNGIVDTVVGKIQFAGRKPLTHLV